MKSRVDCGCPILKLAGCLILAVSIMTTASNAAPASLTRSEQAQLYDEAIHILGGNANVISRWVNDIRFSVVGEASPGAAAQALATLADVAKQTNLSWRSVASGPVSAADYLEEIQNLPPFHAHRCELADCANFVVVFSTVDTMRELATAIPLRTVFQRSLLNSNEVDCFFAPTVTPKMEISHGFVFVRQDLPDAMVQTCLNEEIYQSFGLFNDYSGSRYFSFNNVVAPKRITRYDRALLAAVYDPQFRAGAPVFKVVGRLMEILGYDLVR